MTLLNQFWLYHIRRRLMLTVFLFVGLAGAVLAGVLLLIRIVFSPYGSQPMKIAIGFDQLANAATGGNEDETISKRAGRERNNGTRWACVLCKLLDHLDNNHCENAKN